MWGISGPFGAVAGGGSAPVVAVSRTTITVSEIHFATAAHGNENWHYIYESVSTHGIAPGDLQYWARGNKITTPEWANGGSRNLNSCWTRNNPVSMRVKLVGSTSASVSGTLTCTPKLDGEDTPLTAATVSFTYPASAAEHWVNVQLGGVLPNEIGRFGLELRWTMSGANVRFGGPATTRHLIYAAYAQPLDPAWDSTSPGATGAGHETTRDEGTLTGTRKRFDHMMTLLGSTKRHAVGTTDEMVDLYWRLHKGINDTPGAPPYFNGANTHILKTRPRNPGTALTEADNWLAFATTPSMAPEESGSRRVHWNDASCIGHVQLMKTMLAAVGLFSRRTWVFPHTKRLPDGSIATFANDTDLYCLGRLDDTKLQKYTLTAPDGTTYDASPRLMEPGQAWENFEACMVSPTGKFLTGGYQTTAESSPEEFRRNKGFNSARELLRWWCRTDRPGFGRRFMAWVYADRPTRTYHIWDKEGTHYRFADYVQIRQRGKDLEILDP